MRRYGAHHAHGARVDDGWTYRGIATVVLENEHLRATILAGKGADVASLVHKPTDTELLWRSPTWVRDPATYTPTTGEGTWLDHYEGGWQTILPNFGGPGTTGGAPLGQHGEANLLPWDVAIIEDGPDEAVVEFEVALVRTPLRVRKQVRVAAGSPAITVIDTISNVGGDDLRMSFGQHLVFGAPLLDDTTTIDLAGGRVLVAADQQPRTRLQAGGEGKWPNAPGLDGEQVDLRQVPPADADTEDIACVTDLIDGSYRVTNPGRGLTVEVTFDREHYPFLWLWQVHGGGHGYPWWGRTQCLGLEPVSSWDHLGIDEAIRNGTAATIAAGSSITTTTVVRATSTTDGQETDR